VNGNVKLGRAAARSGEWAQHFSNASCLTSVLLLVCTHTEQLPLQQQQQQR